MSKENTTLAFLAGALAGGVAALLMAPRSGRETREQLQETTREALDQGREKVGDAADAVSERARGAQQTLTDRATDVARTAENQVEAVREAADAGRSTYQQELQKRQESAS